MGRKTRQDKTPESFGHYPRRFPRIGPAYQLKFDPNDTKLLARPAPTKMSNVVPFRSEQEVVSGIIEDYDTASNEPNGASAVSSTPWSSKGYETFHQPGVDQLDYLAFAQPLVENLPQTPIQPSTIDNNDWTVELVQWYHWSQHSSTSRKSRFKRSRESDWPSFNRAPKWQKVTSGRSEETTLAFYSTQPSFEQARWTTLVQMSAGQASASIRARERRLFRERFQQPSMTTSESWRQAYRQSTAVWIGDYRNGAVNEWDAPTISLDKEHARDVWNAMLACGHDIEKRLKEGKSVLFSELLSFFAHAYRLPVPEELFKAHMVEEIATCMWSLWDQILIARKLRAKLMDLWYENGVDVEIVRKELDTVNKETNIQLDEVEQLRKQIDNVAKWESRLQSFLDNIEADEDRDDLVALNTMVIEARFHGLRSKGLVEVEEKIARIDELRGRILNWYQARSSNSKESVKFLSALVRDIQRIKLRFPEANDVLTFSRRIDEWIDRANVAIRSRISLDEIKQLIEKGDSWPVDLSEYMEKLQSRVSAAEEWLERLGKIVSGPESASLEWTRKVRRILEDEGRTELHDLATEGGRIPVEVECVKLLQVELDARQWIIKAKKWLPSETAEDESRKGKIEDIRDHVEKAEQLRERLILSKEEREAWALDGEKELISIVDAADGWYDEYEEYLEFDNRRNNGRSCLSIEKLREIVQRGSEIYANVGNLFHKMTKILEQSEEWYERYHDLIDRCSGTNGGVIDLSEIKNAVQDASTISLDLEEAIYLKKLNDRIESWIESVSIATGSKRPKKGKKASFSIDDLFILIKDASNLPINCQREICLLETQLSTTRFWQKNAASDLEAIASGFGNLRETLREAYGDPSSFNRNRTLKQNEKDVIMSDVDNLLHVEDTIPVDDDDRKIREDSSVSGTISTESDVLALVDHYLSGHNNVKEHINKLLNESRKSCIVTPETELASQLEVIWRWCMKSFEYLESNRGVFDKRFFGAFDRFVNEGKDLMEIAVSHTNNDLVSSVSEKWSAVVGDQLVRLEVLGSERNAYICWCNVAEASLFDDNKRPTFERLNEIAKQSEDFPDDCELVVRVKALKKNIDRWIDDASDILGSDEKPSMQEVKELFTEGEKNGIQCNELKALRAGIKAAKSWAAKVRKCKIDQGTTSLRDVKSLASEYEDLIVVMPDEFAKLNGAMKNYCICRRPYEGFMIGCDHCSDWFHGPCIGISENRADKVEKYTCLRCLISRNFDGAAKMIGGILRKWTSAKDLKKARQNDTQRHQRKVRKETKDIEKLREKEIEIERQLTKMKSRSCEVDSSRQSNVSVSTEENEKSVCSFAASSEKDGRATDVNLFSPDMQPQDVAMSADVTDCTQSVTFRTKDELERDHQRTLNAIKQCSLRLETLKEASIMNKEQEALEDEHLAAIQRWCVRVRSLVLVPSTKERAIESCPLQDGTLSSAMKGVIADADRNGLLTFQDVNTVINCFKCLAWCLQAALILLRQPTDGEVLSLISQTKDLALIDEKPIKLLKALSQRASAWKSKVTRALAPMPGESKPYDLGLLRDLADLGDDIPLTMTLEPRLMTVIDDKGLRHCLCGGPSDGRFMVSCDACDRWFHGHCVGIAKETSDSLEDWKCPKCSGSFPDLNSLHPKEFQDKFDADPCMDDSSCTDAYESSKAQKVDEMWPPFGLAGSQKAVEVIGDSCASFPDDLDEWGTPTHYINRPVLADRKETASESCSYDQNLSANPAEILKSSPSVISSSNHFINGHEIIRKQNGVTKEAAGIFSRKSNDNANPGILWGVSDKGTTLYDTTESADVQNDIDSSLVEGVCPIQEENPPVLVTSAEET